MEQEIKSADPETITEARKRTRSILHVTVGIPGVWEPTSEELDAVAKLFQDALTDPVGAVIATRTGVYPVVHTADEGDVKVVAVSVTEPPKTEADGAPKTLEQ